MWIKIIHIFLIQYTILYGKICMVHTVLIWTHKQRCHQSKIMICSQSTECPRFSPKKGRKTKNEKGKGRSIKAPPTSLMYLYCCLIIDINFFKYHKRILQVAQLDCYRLQISTAIAMYHWTFTMSFLCCLVNCTWSN